MDEGLKNLRELRRLISMARETCAGSNIKQFSEVRRLVNDASKKAVELRYDAIAKTLNTIWHTLLRAKAYGDRLPPDRILCNILNRLDGMIKTLEQV